MRLSAETKRVRAEGSDLSGHSQPDPSGGYASTFAGRGPTFDCDWYDPVKLCLEGCSRSVGRMHGDRRVPVGAPRFPNRG